MPTFDDDTPDYDDARRPKDSDDRPGVKPPKDIGKALLISNFPDLPDFRKALKDAVSELPDEHATARKYLTQLLKKHGYGETMKLIDQVAKANITGEAFQLYGAANTVACDIAVEPIEKTVTRRKMLKGALFGTATLGLMGDAYRRKSYKMDAPAKQTPAESITFQLVHNDTIAPYAEYMVAPVVFLYGVANVFPAIDERFTSEGSAARENAQKAYLKEIVHHLAPTIDQIVGAYHQKIGMYKGR